MWFSDMCHHRTKYVHRFTVLIPLLCSFDILIIRIYPCFSAWLQWRRDNHIISLVANKWTWKVWVQSTGNKPQHYDDVIMTMLASQITSLPVVCSIVYSDVNQRKHQSSASLAFVREIHRGPVNFPHKWPVTRKMFPFDDVIMNKTAQSLTMGIIF